MQKTTLALAGLIAAGGIVLGSVGGAAAGALINSADIQNGSIRDVDLGFESVDADEVDNGTLTGQDVMNDSLTGADLATNSVQPGDINLLALEEQLDVADDAKGSLQDQRQGVGTLSLGDGQSVVLLDVANSGAAEARVTVRNASGTVIARCVAPAASSWDGQCASSGYAGPGELTVSAEGDVSLGDLTVLTLAVRVG